MLAPVNSEFFWRPNAVFPPYLLPFFLDMGPPFWHSLGLFIISLNILPTSPSEGILCLFPPFPQFLGTSWAKRLYSAFAPLVEGFRLDTPQLSFSWIRLVFPLSRPLQKNIFIVHFWTPFFPLIQIQDPLRPLSTGRAGFLNEMMFFN